MKNVALSRLALTLGIICLALTASCRSPLSGLTGPVGVLTITLPSGAGARGLGPAEASARSLAAHAGTIATWRLTGEGPQGRTYEGEFSAEQVTSNDNKVTIELALGDWTITIRGLDTDGAVTFTATQAVKVKADESATCAMTLTWAEKALVARLSFDEGIKEDRRGLAVTPTAGLAIGFADGAGPNGSSYITLPDSALHYIDLGAIDLGSSFTISFWVRFTDLGDRALVTSRSGAAPNGFTLFLKTNSLQLETPEGIVTANDAIMATETWYHVTFSIDNIQRTGSLYINDSVPQTGPAGIGNAALPIRFGAALDNPTAMSGSIDTIHIYSGTLDQQEVAQLYRRGFFAGGDGTSTDPYMIGNPTQFSNISKYPNQYYVQLSDIDLKNDPWTGVDAFSGHYNGNNKTIRNLRLASGPQGAGLFSRLIGGTIHDLTLDTVSGNNDIVSVRAGSLAACIDGSANLYNITARAITLSSSAQKLGGLIGEINSTGSSGPTTIHNIAIDAPTLSGLPYIGGLIGLIGGTGTHPITIENSRVLNLNITAQNTGSHVGGLIGQTGPTTTIRHSRTTGAISSINPSVQLLGGFIGNMLGSAERCTADVAVGPADGTTFSGAQYLGGFAGQIQDPAVLTDCHATGTVRGNGDTAGFAGIIKNSSGNPLTLTNCTATGAINSASGTNVGGFIGSTSVTAGTITITGCAATGAVTAPTGQYVGGFAGLLTSGSGGPTITVTSCSSSGNISASSFVGGFAGVANHISNIASSHSTGTVHASGGTGGGFTGSAAGSGTISQCYATGSVTGTRILGGFTGNLGDTAKILQSYATGSVTGTNVSLGGFAGIVLGGAIENCYARGDVTMNGSATGVAGFAGKVTYTGATVKWSYSSGTITNGSGAFIGSTDTNKTYNGSNSGCYWHNTTAGSLSNPNIAAITGTVTGPSDIDLTEGTDYGSWNATGYIWRFAAGSFPRLAWEPTP